MVQWANEEYGGRVHLLMLCMEVGSDGLRTAKWFGQHFKVPSTIVNGYINKQSEVPRFGQLGCGGFIVLGPSGEFVSRRTSPSYLKKGTGGFTAVEEILSTLGVERNGSGLAAVKRQNNDSAMLQLNPVGNAQMDEEHADLVSAGADLMKQRSVSSLYRLRDLWDEHSKHEEALFEKHNFGGARSGDLSGTASHREHHRVILQSFDEVLQSFDQSNDCCATGVVGEKAVQDILAELQRHGDVYDSAYAGKLGESEVKAFIKGSGEHGTKWMWSNTHGDFEVEFNKDGSFYCDDFPRDAHWEYDGEHLIIDWADLGIFEMKVDINMGTMKGCYTTSHPHDRRKAKYIGELDQTHRYDGGS